VTDDSVREEVQALRDAGLHRALRCVDGAQRERIVLDGREVLNFASNNYLGLADHPALRRAARDAIDRVGLGAGASRLVTGTMSLHLELERRIAEFESAPAAILFNSGYCANVGAVSALVGRGAAVLGDRLNHASLVDGCRLSGAAFSRYRHNDLEDLERRLKAAAGSRRRLVVTDTVFSVDGDVAPLAEIADLCRAHDALLMVDEAHATGVFGPRGRGVVEAVGLQGRVDLVMGTLSKAVGSAGGYVAASEPLVDLLRNKARSFIYTTALPPAVCAASIAGLDLIDTEPERREKLWRNVTRLRSGLARLGVHTGAGASQIVPLIVGEPDAAVALSERLLEAGVFAPALRPPTVPPGTSRLRLSVMATHEDEHIDLLLEALSRALT